MSKVKQIIIDSNLLVLFVIGLTDRNLISKHKRTKQYEIEDYDLLAEILSTFNKVIVTPHVLAETSNLISQIGNPVMSSIRETLKNLIETQSEEYEPSRELCKGKSFIRLGLTDCAILNLVKKELPLITVDLDLYLSAMAINHNTVNFNHLRESRLLNI